MDSVTASAIEKLKSIVHYQTSLSVVPIEAEKILAHRSLLEARVEQLRQALVDLVGDLNAGIVFDCPGQHCIYCNFQDDDDLAPVRHDRDCPIQRGREALPADVGRRMCLEERS